MTINAVLATPVLVTQTTNTTRPTGPTDTSHTPIVKQSDLTSVPFKTKVTHYAIGTHGTETINVLASVDGVNWIILGTITANNQLTTDGNFPYMTHEITGAGGGTSISTWMV